MITLPKSMDDVQASREFKVAPAGTYEFEIKSAVKGVVRTRTPRLIFVARLSMLTKKNITKSVCSKLLLSLKMLCSV